MHSTVTTLSITIAVYLGSESLSHECAMLLGGFLVPTLNSFNLVGRLVALIAKYFCKES